MKWGEEIHAGYDATSINDAALQAQIDKLRSDVEKVTRLGGVVGATPEPCTPDFVLAYERHKQGVRARMCLNVSPGTVRVKVVICPTSLRSDQDEFEENVLKDDYDLDPEQTNTGHVEFKFSPTLLFNTQYDLVRIVSYDANGEGVVSPSVEPVYNTPPITQFTTPASVANAPSKPTLARIISNNDDQVVLRVFADETETKTFGEQETDTIIALILKSADTDVKIKPLARVEDTSDTFIDLTVPVGDPELGQLKVGNTYEWSLNRAWAGDASADAPSTSTIEFVAGGYADPDDGVDEDHGMVNLTCSFDFDNSSPYSSTIVKVTATVTQPSTPYRLRHAKLYLKKTADSDSTYYQVADTFPLQSPEFNTASQSFDLVAEVTTGVNKNYTFKLIVTSVRDPNGIDHSFTDTYASGMASASASASASGGDRSLVVGGSFQASVDDETVAGGGASVPADQKYPMRDWETSANSGTRINNTATGGGGATIDSAGIQWRNTEGRLKLTTSLVSLGGKPAVKLGKLLRKNDVVAICPSFICDTADITPTISFALVDQTGGDMVVVSAASFPISHTVEQRGIWILQVPNSYTGTAKQWLELRLSANPAQNLYTWNWQLSFGVLYRDFKVNAEEQAVLDFLDTTPLTTKVYTTDIKVIAGDGEEYIINQGGPITF